MTLRNLFLLFVLTWGGAAAAGAGNWAEWRGARGDGIVAGGGYPQQWSATENVLWKAPMPARGNSSPVIFGQHVFVTCANVDGSERSLLAFDRAQGRLRWKQTVLFRAGDPTHATNPWCAPSPATDGKRVFVWNGSAGATAYDYEGRQLWHRDLGPFVHQWGHASSPRLHRNLVIIFGSPGPRIRLTALDQETGRTVWERSLDHLGAPPQELQGAFATPLLWPNGPRSELLLPLPHHLASFNADTGEELWRCEGLGNRSNTDVIVGSGVILGFSAGRGPAIGLRAPGPTETGNLTATHRIWTKDTALQNVSAGVVVGDRYYLAGRLGELQCADIRTGEVIWTHRLREAVWSAVSLVGDSLYLTDQAARTHVFEPADTYRLLHTNLMAQGERTNSTLAFAGGQLFLRTFDNLYALAAPTGDTD